MIDKQFNNIFNNIHIINKNFAHHEAIRYMKIIKTRPWAKPRKNPSDRRIDNVDQLFCLPLLCNMQNIFPKTSNTYLHVLAPPPLPRICGHFWPFGSIFAKKKIPYWPAPGLQKGRGQKYIFLRTCSPVGSSICKRLQDKKAHLWRFVAIFDHFWPFFLQLAPKRPSMAPPK